MMVARVWGRGKWESSDDYRVLDFQGENILEIYVTHMNILNTTEHI